MSTDSIASAPSDVSQIARRRPNPGAAVVAAVKADAPAYVLIAFGVLLRVGRYVQDRSLWLDEASLAVNLMSRGYGQLFDTLDFDQGAPFGFLVFEKFAISTLGDGELAFRLFPLLAGVASLFVFWRVATRFLDRLSALVALAFFAVLEPLVYYSSETKQYSFDVLVALVLVWLFDRALTAPRRSSLLVFAAAALAAPWLSFASIFVVAGCSGALVLAPAASRDLRAALARTAVAGVGLGSFLVVYLTSIRDLSGGLKASAEAASGPASVGKNLYVLFSDAGGMPRTLIGLSVLLVAIGALALGRQSWPRLAAIGLTGAAAAGAALLQRYPLEGRLALFLIPLALLLLGLGATNLVLVTPMPIRGVVALFVLALLAVPVWQGLVALKRPPTEQVGAPATLQPTERLLERLTAQWKPRDVLYVSVKSQLAFRYYLTCDNCNGDVRRQASLWPFRPVSGPTQTSRAIDPIGDSLVAGSSGGDLESYLSDFERLRGQPRVWFLFTHTPPVDASMLEIWLNREGRQLAALREGTAAALLYDLRPR